jgi:anti-sigma-K factor RskA
MSVETKRITDLVLERYVLGELDADHAAELSAQLKSDPELARRVAAIVSSNDEILAQYPPERMALDIRARAGAAPKRANSNRWLMVAAPLVAAAAVAMFVLIPQGQRDGGGPLGPEIVDTTRTKGVLAPELVILRQDEDGTARLGPGSDVAPGDKLQFGYIAGGAKHGVIGIVDGTGASAVLSADGRLEWSGEVVLPDAIELEETGGFLRVVFIADDVEVDEAAIRRALEEVAQSDDPAGAELRLDGRPVVLDVVLPEILD